MLQRCAVALCCLVWATPGRVEAQSLSIGEVVAEALAASPALRAQRTRAAGAQTAAPLTGRLPNPTFSWMGQGLRRNPPTVLQPDHGVFVTQSLPLGGQRSARRRLAVADVGVADTMVDVDAEAVALDAVARAIDVVRASQSLTVLDVRRQGLDELVRIQQRRVEEGTAPLGDLSRLQAEQVRVRIATARLEADARRARVALCAALGRTTCDDLEVQAPPPSLLGVPGDAEVDQQVDTRPSVRAAVSRLEQARMAKSVADAAVWPALDVTAGYQRTQFLDTGLAGLSMTVPLFDREHAPRARADAALAAAGFDVEQARREARAQMRQLAGIATDLAGHAGRDDLMAPALAAQRAARSAFREGDADLVRLLDAEQLVADASLDALALTLDAAQAALHTRVLLGLPLP